MTRIFGLQVTLSCAITCPVRSIVLEAEHQSVIGHSFLNSAHLFSIASKPSRHLATIKSSTTAPRHISLPVALEVIQGLGWIWKGGRGGGEGWRGGGLEDGCIAGEDRPNQFGLFRTTALPQPTWEDAAPLPSSVQLSAASSAHCSTPRCPHLLLVSPSHPPYKLGPSNSWCKTAPVAKVEKTSRAVVVQLLVIPVGKACTQGHCRFVVLGIWDLCDEGLALQQLGRLPFSFPGSPLLETLGKMKLRNVQATPKMNLIDHAGRASYLLECASRDGGEKKV
ncbi:hypothetical protein BJ741DRAFT_653627 [Chytriomyces cf. hyalinus JEL632]|nr:hypothetical protein BJ741DRAFT_653627 [Chytriomyces cf. hyalinus JEL632]